MDVCLLLSLPPHPLTPSLLVCKEPQTSTNLLRTLQHGTLLLRAKKAEICVSAVYACGVAIGLHILQLVWFLETDSHKAPQEIRIKTSTDKVSLGHLNWQSEEGRGWGEEILSSSEGCTEQSFFLPLTFQGSYVSARAYYERALRLVPDSKLLKENLAKLDRLERRLQEVRERDQT